MNYTKYEHNHAAEVYANRCRKKTGINCFVLNLIGLAYFNFNF
jgi:hypothetical protein